MKALSVATILALAASLVPAQDLAVKVTVAEPVGLERKAGPASGGVPFKKGQVKDVADLALFDKGGKPVPAQFSRLCPYDDGSVQWALADFLLDLPAKCAAEFTVRAGKAAAPAQPLAIEETEEKIAVNTGPATFAVGKGAFTVLDSVTVDGRPAAGPGALALMNGEGKSFTAGKPAKVSWEYKGPVRATLRVDGPFTGEAGEYTAYTVRLTFWAGSAAVRVETSIRNSHPTDGFDARIREATLTLALPGGGSEKGQGADWAAAGDDKGGVLVTDRHTAGCFPAKLHRIETSPQQVRVFLVPPAPAGAKKPIGYGEGFFALADLAHKDSEIWLDFHAGARDAAANEARTKALRSKLVALADGAWISETGALGPGRFGTLADEIATYKKWGWKGWDDPAKRANARKAHVPDAFVDKVDIHDESESDSVELFMLMFVRTGERGFFDLGEAYARYYKGHAVWRTDGFEYDGFRHERSGVNSKSKRKSTGLTHGWYSPKEYGWSDSRFHMCHQWATGLIDFYCLTGDVDALEAGLDWAEYAAATYPEQKPGQNHSWGRAWGRSFGIVLRAWQATGDPKWKAHVDTFAGVAIKAPNRLPSGLFANNTGSMTPYFVRETLEPKPNSKDPPMPPRLKAYIEEQGLTWKVKGGDTITLSNKVGKSWIIMSSAQSFEYEACAGPVERYTELTGDPEGKKLLVDLAKCARQFYWSTKCEHAIPKPYINFPDEGKVFDAGVWNDDHAKCPANGGGKHSGYHTRFLTDIFARAHAASGDKEWLDWAKKAWNRGSKRGYWTTSQSVPDDEVAAFVGHSAPKGDQLDIRNSMRLFYEVAHAP